MPPFDRDKIPKPPIIKSDPAGWCEGEKAIKEEI